MSNRSNVTTSYENFSANQRLALADRSQKHTFGSEIKQGNAYFWLEDEEIVDYVLSTERLYFATER